jgi:hypothetical protein
MPRASSASGIISLIMRRDVVKIKIIHGKAAKTFHQP